MGVESPVYAMLYMKINEDSEKTHKEIQITCASDRISWSIKKVKMWQGDFLKSI